MSREMCSSDGCLARPQNGEKCNKCLRGGRSACTNGDCDNPVYLDGECITCKFPRE